ncbi:MULTISPECIES: glycine cleavage system protein R [Aliagarivorans]|uniref:glycine cleavage system protein R n=1 Tax=Aliagarivorans TaxID=882379 RepID=UPI00041727DB|nr:MULTISPECIES: ACT domain-containing protein [Aliagarivorans]
MTQHLVVTAVGTDRPGIVNQLTQLASQCGCNIVDSRMALFGSEFTLIMLLSGEHNAMLQIETRLPIMAQQLQLLTVLKPTTPHTQLDYHTTALLQLTITDSPGVISQVTQLISDHGLDLVGLKSNLFSEQGNEMLSAEFEAKLSTDADHKLLSADYDRLCEKLGTQQHQLQFLSI